MFNRYVELELEKMEKKNSLLPAKSSNKVND